MSDPASVIAMTAILLPLATIVVFLVYVVIKYSPIVGRIFEEKPLFLPLRVPRGDEGEDVWFTTRDRLRLAGTYLKARTPKRSGVLVFCHEYLSDRWSFAPYADHLRDQGFDLFTFDFRNHGQSPKDPIYNPLQWVTDHELYDLRAALAYLRSRPDADPAGVGVYGISRGGGTGLCVAGGDPRVWGLVTDGAFPTRGMMLSYINRWAKIYVGTGTFWKLMPQALFQFLSWSARLRTQIKLHCRYPNVERAAARLAPRPWLMIHGEKDAYIGVNVARGLFDLAGEPKELWIVAGAKHNRCREKEPIAYRDRVAAFFRANAPRGPRQVVAAVAQPTPAAELPIATFDAVAVPADLGVPVAG